MQPSTSNAQASPARSFAGFLASFTAAGEDTPLDLNPDEGFEDVANLSYEQALRGRTTFRPELTRSRQGENSKSTSSALTSPALSSPVPDDTAFWPLAGIGSDALNIEIAGTEMAGTELAGQGNATLPPVRRTSSITIRMSAAENQQLHLRAKEAGLTVSAYLRSCAFEVESLRAEVKAMMSQLRSDAVACPEQKTGRPHFWNLLSRRKPHHLQA